MNLRPYQTEALDAVRNRKVGRGIVALPTGCLTGDTVVSINRHSYGHKITLAEWHKVTQSKKYNPETKTKIRSLMGDHIGLAIAHAVIYTGFRPVYRIMLENGMNIKGTHDHKIMTEHGWVPIGLLKRGDNIICEGRSKYNKTPKKNYRMTQGLKHHPYAGMVEGKRTKGNRKSEGRLFRVATHRLVIEAKMNRLDLREYIECLRTDAYSSAGFSYIDPSIFAVHHINGNHLDNSIENLTVQTHESHWVEHGIKENYKNFGYSNYSYSKLKWLKYSGMQNVYDVMVEDPYHNFIANGIVVHNCGKGHIAGNLTEALGTRNVLYLAHREELINQLAEHVERVVGWGQVEIEQANRRAYSCAPVIVASVPTLIASEGKRMKRLGLSRFEAVVVDECHHATSESYRAIWRYHGILNEDDTKPDVPRIPLIGLTATPGRGDNVGLCNVFDDILYQMRLSEAIKKGWLVPVHAWTVKTETDLSQVRVSRGDYSEGELARAVSTESRNEIILDACRKYATGLKSLIFCVTVEHSRLVSEYFCNAGIEARWIAGTMKPDERAGVLKWFSDTPGAVLCNCQIVTEGVDLPSVECVVMARPTKSATLYAQCLSEDTEVLTKRGFVGPDEYKSDDEVASFDLSTGDISFDIATDKIDRPLGGLESMYEYDTNMASLRVTGGHRMVYRIRQGRKRTLSGWSLNIAENLSARPDSYFIPVSGNYKARGIFLPDNDLRFVAWVLTDGSIGKYNNAVTITQNKSNEKTIRSIESTLKACGFKYNRSEITGDTNFGKRSSILYRYTISYGKPRGTGKHLTGWGRLKDWMFYPNLAEMNDRQFECFLEVVNMADGSRQLKKYFSHGAEWTKRSMTIGKHKRFIDWLQSMACVRGYRTVSNGTGNRYVLHLKKQEALYVGGATSKDRPSLKVSKSSVGERVWCLTTKFGTMVVRRKGRVSIVGNCLGRGTRLAKGAYDYTESVALGKDRMILLDITDNADVAKRAVNISDIFGAPLANKPVKGQSMTEVVEQQEMELKAQADIRAVAVASSLSLFDDTLEVPGSQYSWYGQDQSIRLNLGGKGVVTCETDVMDRWTGKFWDKNTREVRLLCFDGSNQREFIRKVEDWVALNFPDTLRLIDKNASWRDHGPSDKQVNLCRKLGIHVPENATKGQVSMALDNYFSRKKRA